MSLSISTAPKETSGVSDTALLSPYHVLQQFMMPRNLAIRPNPSRRKMLPVQIYRGLSVPAASKAPRVNDDDFISNLPIDLSNSSRSLLDRYDTLSSDEQKQFRVKVAADARARASLDPAQHLHILYLDQHICVTSKLSGILSVPGPRRNPSLANLVYDVVQPDIDIDQMVVHRLDMDTSGVLVFALTTTALRQLHKDFRDRKVRKSYIALLTGHLHGRAEVEVDLALERDPLHPPFMRVAQSSPAIDSGDTPKPMTNKMFQLAPKPSWTDLSILSLEYVGGEADEEKHRRRLPVTRVSLTPHTGRTHQLRVHCAALGFPIVGDDIYGYHGSGDCGVAHDGPEQMQRDIVALRMPLCLHAHQLCLFHPLTGAPMVFECDAPF